MTDTPMHSFIPIDWYYISGRGWVAAVKPEGRRVTAGDTVAIGGYEYICKGIESHPTTTPPHQQPVIGLLIEGDV